MEIKTAVQMYDSWRKKGGQGYGREIVVEGIPIIGLVSGTVRSMRSEHNK